MPEGPDSNPADLATLLRKIDVKFDRLHVEMRQFLDRTSPHVSRFERMTAQVRGEEALEREKSWERVQKHLDAVIAHYEHGTPLLLFPEAPPTELEYAVTIKPVRDSGYVALVPDLPGCIAGARRAKLRWPRSHGKSGLGSMQPQRPGVPCRHHHTIAHKQLANAARGARSALGLSPQPPASGWRGAASG